VNLQAELLAKVIEYDRSFPARAGERAHVLIVVKEGNPDSSRFASTMQTALGRRDQIAGLPHDEQIGAFTTATDLAAACRERHIAVIYLGPGFGEVEVGAIRAALEGVDVLSVAAVPEYVEQGIVLGFDLISGRPKLLFHLTQAKKQHVVLRGEALKLMKVFE
jgi:YfiR/HmsC-like